MIDLFDAYELRARIFPAVLIVSPLVFPFVPIVKFLGLEISETVYLIVIFFAIIYLIAMLLRFRGKNKESAIWNQWGDVPSTQLMLESNTAFGKTTKSVLRKKVNKDFQIEIVPESAEEKENVAEAFKLIKSLLSNEKGLLYKHNCEYGFLRNLYSNYVAWLCVGLSALIISGILVYIHFTYDALFALGISFFYLVIILAISKRRLMNKLKSAAFTYAQTAWARYYHYKSE